MLYFGWNVSGGDVMAKSLRELKADFLAKDAEIAKRVYGVMLDSDTAHLQLSGTTVEILMNVQSLQLAILDKLIQMEDDGK